MKTISTVYSELKDILRKLYSSREAENIAKIYFEDKYNIKSINDNIFPPEFSKIIIEDIERFKNGEPVQYITGKAFFYDNFFKVDSSVLIPRPETELLVDLAIKYAKNIKSPGIIDIGTGSGCIALSIAQKVTSSEILAIDISPAALKTANENKDFLQIRNVVFTRSDFLKKSERDGLGDFDMIVSNPPYISPVEKKYMTDSTLKFEPDIALFPDSSNHMIFYEKIIDFAENNLRKNGIVICEINEFRVKEIKDIVSVSSFKFDIIEDMQNKPRILKLWK